MRLKLKQKFPCGYELEYNVETFRRVDMEALEFGICPLHGKNCTKQGGKK